MIDNQKKELLEKKSRTLNAIRDFFLKRGYVEVDTPLAVRFPDQEPTIHPVPVILSDDKGTGHNFYLHTSPEYAMKKLLAGGMHKIFQISKCFRNNESFGGTHQPEFTMLEWYSTKMDYKMLMNEVDDLIAVASADWGRKFVLPSQRYSVRELFKKYTNIKIDNWSKLSTIEYEEKFFEVFLNKIEPYLPKEPTIVYDYPVQLGALARRKKDDPEFAERFELYINGLEVANAFGELLDADEQRIRFEQELNVREKRGKETFPIDQELLEALPHIPEPTSGIALGIDRLIMALEGTNKIIDVVAFPFD